MLKSLRKWLNEPTSANTPHRHHDELRLAVASLFHEARRVDLDDDSREHEVALDGLMALFGTSRADAEALLAAGRERAAHLSSYFSVTSVIKREWSLDQRILLIERMWRIAYADAGLHPDEDHFVRKIAHLLYVPNTQSMLARARARAG